MAELAEIGVRRISVGGAFAFAALDAAAQAARELREAGQLRVLGPGQAGCRGSSDAFGVSPRRSAAPVVAVRLGP